MGPDLISQKQEQGSEREHRKGRECADADPWEPQAGPGGPQLSWKGSQRDTEPSLQMAAQPSWPMAAGQVGVPCLCCLVQRHHGSRCSVGRVCERVLVSPGGLTVLPWQALCPLMDLRERGYVAANVVKRRLSLHLP